MGHPGPGLSLPAQSPTLTPMEGVPEEEGQTDGLSLFIPVHCGPSREGEFTVQVLAFNDVSTASLRKQLFIVREPCQPPPVKNMGPGKVQVGLDWNDGTWGSKGRLCATGPPCQTQGGTSEGL